MSPDQFRREADRYRLLAGAESNAARAKLFRSMALKCEDFAEELERHALRRKQDAVESRTASITTLFPGR